MLSLAASEVVGETQQLPGAGGEIQDESCPTANSTSDAGTDMPPGKRTRTTLRALEILRSARDFLL